jgi:hypothetical protein
MLRPLPPSRSTVRFASFLVFCALACLPALYGCTGGEGDRCKDQSNCGSGLTCCPAVRGVRICMPPGECPTGVTPADAAVPDAAPGDAVVPDAAVDAAGDAEADATGDAAADANAIDATMDVSTPAL